MYVHDAVASHNRALRTKGIVVAKKRAKSKPAGKATQPVRVSDLLRLPAGTVDLSGFDPRATAGAPGNRAATEDDMHRTAPQLAELQTRLYAEGVGGGGRRVVLLLQGMDTSGKDGATKHVAEQVNPQGIAITSFKVPTPAERRHDFLWRIRRAVPAPGFVGIFNRSQYEDVLVVRVHNLVPQTEWETRYDRINSFERELADDGVHLIKVFLNLSKDEQKQRLIDRLDDPTKQWKYNPKDVDERGFWDDYQKAYTDALVRCSTVSTPWYVVAADRKWYRNWAIGRLLLEALEDLAPQYPPADYDVTAERGRVDAS
jgi:PPK2 family polyphosphate:nucleotide phosphotransferase